VVWIYHAAGDPPQGKTSPAFKELIANSKSNSSRYKLDPGPFSWTATAVFNPGEAHDFARIFLYSTIACTKRHCSGSGLPPAEKLLLAGIWGRASIAPWQGYRHRHHLPMTEKQSILHGMYQTGLEPGDLVGVQQLIG